MLKGSLIVVKTKFIPHNTNAAPRINEVAWPGRKKFVIHVTIAAGTPNKRAKKALPTKKLVTTLGGLR
jgi:hypothetical protein